MDVPVCLFCSGPSQVSLSKVLKLTVRITLGHTYHKYARRTTCLYEIFSMFVFRRCSFRKADAKVEVLTLPTKHYEDFFLRFFVNKYNLLVLTGVGGGASGVRHGAERDLGAFMGVGGRKDGCRETYRFVLIQPLKRQATRILCLTAHIII